MLQRTRSEYIRSLLKNVLAQIKDSRSGQVREVRLALGEIAEIGQQTIQSHWLELSKDTPAEGVQLSFRLIPAEVQCMACFQKYHPEGGAIRCPYCGGFGAKILAGEEFYLDSME